MSHMVANKVVVICPVKNESWIIDCFLKAASEYADHIILGDHGSTDDTVGRSLKFPKVTIVDSKSSGFDERLRRNRLLDEARKLGPNNLILAVDADEIIDPRFIENGGIKRLLALPIGTRIHFPSFNLFTDFRGYWESPVGATGFIDDGSVHFKTSEIHFPRIPPSEFQGSLRKKLRKYTNEYGGLVHFQYLDWGRVLSKTLWYKAWEVANVTDRSILQIYRRYEHIQLVHKRKVNELPSAWMPFFQKIGVPEAVLRSKSIGKYWWEAETADLMAKTSETTLSILGFDTSMSEKSASKSKSSTYEARLTSYLILTRDLSQFSLHLLPRLILKLMDWAFDLAYLPRRASKRYS